MPNGSQTNAMYNRESSEVNVVKQLDSTVTTISLNRLDSYAVTLTTYSSVTGQLL